jgi:hypothetical protein
LFFISRPSTIDQALQPAILAQPIFVIPTARIRTFSIVGTLARFENTSKSAASIRFSSA